MRQSATAASTPLLAPAPVASTPAPQPEKRELCPACRGIVPAIVLDAQNALFLEERSHLRTKASYSKQIADLRVELHLAETTLTQERDAHRAEVKQIHDDTQKQYSLLNKKIADLEQRLVSARFNARAEVHSAASAAAMRKMIETAQRNSAPIGLPRNHKENEQCQSQN